MKQDFTLVPYATRMKIRGKNRLRKLWQQNRYPPLKTELNRLQRDIKKDLLNIKQREFQGLVYGTREKADLFVDTLEDSFQENITPYDDDHIDKVDRTWYWDRTRDQASHDPIPIPLGYRGLLDVEKAFDRLWHNGLIFKMINLNYPPYLIHTISVYLLNRTFQVKIQATISKIGHIQAGSPQGSLLSPILYNIYTYDFPTSPLVDICLFADDAAILSQQDTPQKKPRPHPNSTEQSTAPHLKRPHLHQTDPYPQRPKNPSPHIQNKKHSTNKLTPTPTASSISKLPWTLRELTTCLSKQLT
ncbi:RNA-directed DNA polymerase from mobile element jockey [Trichonephila clavipes]|nr:RNA-directed DNA polymerase from mobile element jockey [Trichonephila clavipes]